MKSFFTKEKAVAVSLTLLRLVVGLMFLQAGGMKILGWFGGMPAEAMTPLIQAAGWIELIGGSLFFLGLMTRPVAFILSGQMAFAYFIGHFSTAFWPIQNGGQPAVLYCFIFLFFAAYGAGKWSLDAVICKPKK
ncbi:DoxX family protein [Candidatus Gracilibacteria bacterium]|nr:DoxX family protein [Candidatus Gracilibacteria bacterium]